MAFVKMYYESIVPLARLMCPSKTEVRIVPEFKEFKDCVLINFYQPGQTRKMKTFCQASLSLMGTKVINSEQDLESRVE